MEKINVNLLPEEFLAEKKLGVKRALFLRISIIVAVTFFILTSSVLLVRLTQTQRLEGLTTDLESSKNVVTGLKDNEGVIYVLKNRLDKISQIIGVESVPVQAYTSVATLIPPGATMNSFSMTKNDLVVLSVQTLDTDTLDVLFTNLLDPNINKGVITGVKLTSIRLMADRIIVDMDLGYNSAAVTKEKKE